MSQVAASKDEIDEIMNEIQSLQKGLAEAAQPAPAPVAAAPKLKAVAPAPSPAPVSKAAAVAEPEDMSDFRPASEGESSMEDTLGAMQSEPSEHPSLLDANQKATDLSQGPSTSNVQDQADALLNQYQSQDEQEVSLSEDSTSHSGDTEMSHDELTTTSADPKDGALTLSLRGSMTLILKYECDGQEVSVGFSDGFLKVALADGTEFKIPVGR